MRSITVTKWLTTGVCWEVKIGLVLLLISKPLLLWGAPPVASLRWRVGMLLFWLAVACLLSGLLRDIWLITTTKFQQAMSVHGKRR